MEGHAALDSVDETILQLLERDGRRSIASIAKHVNLSASAVKRRVDYLERNRIITGYTAIVDRQRHGRRLDAIAELRFSGSSNLDEIRTAVSHLPHVYAIFTTAGDPDAVVWLSVEDSEGFRTAIDGIRRTGRVIGTKTLVILDSWWRGGQKWI
jgi:Lrp/AsnC family transcriptional regulator, leucine-responsive regulatory protein